MYLGTMTNRLSQLEAYPQWSDALAELHRQTEYQPSTLDPDNAASLEGRLVYVNTRDNQTTARRALTLEIGQQDDTFMPVEYRLGLLAALQVVPGFDDVPVQGTRSTRRRRWASASPVDYSGQSIRPETDILPRAKQIGDAIKDVRSKLSKRSPVPVAIVYGGVSSPGDRIDVVKCWVDEPRQAFELAAPHIVDVDGVLSIEFTVPTHITGATRPSQVCVEGYEDADGDFTTLPLPILQKLLGVSRGNVGALYIGNAYVDKCVAEQRHYLRLIERHQQTTAAARTASFPGRFLR